MGPISTFLMVALLKYKSFLIFYEFQHIYIHICICIYVYVWTSLVAQMVVSVYSAGDLVSILGREDSLEKEMATYSSTLA